MSRKDQITGKKALTGNLRSHALNSKKRKFNLNLQKLTVMKNGQKKVLKVSAKTAKKIKKQGNIV